MTGGIVKNYGGSCVVAAAALAMSVVGGSAWAAEQPLNILIYGNSFMAGPNVPGGLKALIAAAGKPTPNVVSGAVYSMDLAYHIANTTSVVINPYSGNPISGISATTGQPTNFISDNSLNNSASGKWDYVVLQELSTKPTTGKTFQGTAWGVATTTSNPTSFKNDAQTLYGMVRADSPNVKPILLETWANYPGISPLASQPVQYRFTGLDTLYPTLTANKDAAGYLAASNQMQAELKQYYGEAASQINGAYPGANVAVVPAGDAMKATGKATFDPSYGGYDPTFWETTAGYSHESSKGALLVELLLYRQIYHDNDTYDHLPYSAVQAAMVSYTGAGLQNGNTGVVDQATWGAITAYADSVPMAVPEPTCVAVLALGGVLLRRARH